jgi:hypothetical protein
VAHHQSSILDVEVGLDHEPISSNEAAGPKGSQTDEGLSMTPPRDPTSLLEQRLEYRVRAYAAGGRAMDAEFTLLGLRGWMLCQPWPFPAPSAWLECLAVLSWSAICSIDLEPEREGVVRNELARQLEYLDGADTLRPTSLDAFRLEQTRIDLYTSLSNAAKPGSSHRERFGLPRFNAADKLTL